MESSFHPMTKHFVLSLNPTAQHDWERRTLRNPIAAERPDLADLIAEALGEEAGDYLVSVNIEVKVLEKVPLSQSERVSVNGAQHPVSTQLKELVA
jgi:hypothetical protein